MILRKTIQQIQSTLSPEHLKIFNFCFAVEYATETIFSDNKNLMSDQLEFLINPHGTIQAMQRFQLKSQTLTNGLNTLNEQLNKIFIPNLTAKNLHFSNQYELLNFLTLKAQNAKDKPQIDLSSQNQLSNPFGVDNDPNSFKGKLIEEKLIASEIFGFEDIEIFNKVKILEADNLNKIQGFIRNQRLIERSETMIISSINWQNSQLNQRKQQLIGHKDKHNRMKKQSILIKHKTQTASPGNRTFGSLQQLVDLEKPTFIPSKHWKILLQLTKKFTNMFPGLTKSLKADKKKWEKFINEHIQINSIEDKIKDFDFPEDWNALKPFEKLMIIQCLKPENFLQASSSIISFFLDQSLLGEVDSYDVINQMILDNKYVELKQPTVIFHEQQSISLVKYIKTLCNLSNLKVNLFDARGFLYMVEFALQQQDSSLEHSPLFPSPNHRESKTNKTNKKHIQNLTAIDAQIVVIENVDELLNQQESIMLVKRIFDFHKITNNPRIKIFLTYKCLPQLDHFRHQDFDNTKEGAFKYLLQNCFSVYLQKPNNIKKYMEKFHQEDYLPQQEEVNRLSQQKSMALDKKANSSPSNVFSLSPSFNKINQTIQKEKLDGEESSTIHKNLRSKIKKDTNYPQHQLAKINDKFTKVIKEHHRDVERVQQRVKYTLNFICSLILFRINHKCNSLQKYLPQQSKMLNISTFQHLIEQTQNFQFKALLEENNSQMYLNQNIDSFLRLSDDFLRTMYASSKTIKKLLKSFFNVNGEYNVIQYQKFFYFFLKDQPYDSEEIKQVINSLPHTDIQQIKGIHPNQEILFNHQQSQLFRDALGNIYGANPIQNESQADALLKGQVFLNTEILKRKTEASEKFTRAMKDLQQKHKKLFQKDTDEQVEGILKAIQQSPMKQIEELQSEDSQSYLSESSQKLNDDDDDDEEENESFKRTDSGVEEIAIKQKTIVVPYIGYRYESQTTQDLRKVRLIAETILKLIYDRSFDPEENPGLTSKKTKVVGILIRKSTQAYDSQKRKSGGLDLNEEEKSEELVDIKTKVQDSSNRRKSAMSKLTSSNNRLQLKAANMAKINKDQEFQGSPTSDEQKQKAKNLLGTLDLGSFEEQSQEFSSDSDSSKKGITMNKKLSQDSDTLDFDAYPKLPVVKNAIEKNTSGNNKRNLKNYKAQSQKALTPENKPLASINAAARLTLPESSINKIRSKPLETIMEVSPLLKVKEEDQEDSSARDAIKEKAKDEDDDGESHSLSKSKSKSQSVSNSNSDSSSSQSESESASFGSETEIESVFDDRFKTDDDKKKAKDIQSQKNLEKKYLNQNIIEEQLVKEQELVKILLDIMKTDLEALLNYIRGDRFQWLNHHLMDLFDNLLNNCVPYKWLINSFPCALKITLRDWIDTLIIKMQYLTNLESNRNNERGELLDLSKLFKPISILQSLLLRFFFIYKCQALGKIFDGKKLQIQNLRLKAEVLDQKPSYLDIQKYYMKYGDKSIQKLFITGIKLVNARFDLVNGLLDEARYREYECLMPAICLQVVDTRDTKDQQIYDNDSISIKVECRGIPIAGTNKGFYYFDNFNDMKEVIEKPDFKNNARFNLKVVQDNIKKIEIGEVDDRRKSKRTMFSNENTTRKSNKRDSSNILNQPNLMNLRNQRSSSFIVLNPIAVRKDEQDTLLTVVRERQSIYQGQKAVISKSVNSKQRISSARTKKNSSTTGFAIFSKEVEASKDDNKIDIGDHDKNELQPFLRRNEKIYEVKIPIVLSFQVRLPEHQEQMRFHLIFRSNFSQSYWDSIGAYAICDPLSLIN